MKEGAWNFRFARLFLSDHGEGDNLRELAVDHQQKREIGLLRIRKRTVEILEIRSQSKRPPISLRFSKNSTALALFDLEMRTCSMISNQDGIWVLDPELTGPANRDSARQNHLTLIRIGSILHLE